MSSTKTKLAILCFGDSLTAGYSAFGRLYTPYSDTLKERLSSQLGHAYDFSIDTDGVSGESVTVEFRERLEKRHGYDYVVFLGGTNDLGCGRSAEKIWEAIEGCTGLMRAWGGSVILCTVPECGARLGKLDRQRNELNDRIRKEEGDGIYVLDLWQGIKYHDMSEEEKDLIWDDGLHFTEEGYKRFGLLVARKMTEILEAKQKNANTSTTDKKEGV